MSLWGFDGEDNSLTTWSSLSQQFDDMVWNEFGDNENHGDHEVPDPNANAISWLPTADRRKKFPRAPSSTEFTNKDSSPPTEGSEEHSEIATSEEEDGSKGGVALHDMLPSAVDTGSWSDLGSVVDLPVESQAFDSNELPAPQETDNLTGPEQIKDQSILPEDVHLFVGEEDGSMVTDPFSYSEMGSEPGGLELFESENAASKTESLLDLGWANIGSLDDNDMDKLFRNNDASFEPVTTETLEWPASATHPVRDSDTGMEFENPPQVSEEAKQAVVKVEADMMDEKIESVSSGTPRKVRSAEDAQPSGQFDNIAPDVDSPKSSNVQPKQQPGVSRSIKSEGTQRAKSTENILSGMERAEETGQSPPSFSDCEKVSLTQAHRARRHAVNRKRSEDRFKKSTSYKKLSPGPPHAAHHSDLMQLQSLPQRLSGPPSHLQIPSPTGLRVFPPATGPGLLGVPHPFQMPQNIPYIQIGYPIQHMPNMSSCSPKSMLHMQYPQPMFVDLQQSGVQLPKPPHPQGLSQPSPLVPKVRVQGPPPSEQQQQPQLRPTYDGAGRLPPSSLSMTPQEKLEKLRWRQQMQARIAVEQQQQQLLASQCVGSMEPFLFPKQPQAMSQGVVAPQTGRLLTGFVDGQRKPTMNGDEMHLGSDGAGPSANSDGDEEDSSLEGSVLRQLEMTISRLDISTRLCIRNALYRLARSARKRRAAGGDNASTSQSSGERQSGANAMESSSGSDPPSCRSSRATSISEMETETNPIDRSIAKLLFYKPPQYMPGPLYLHDMQSFPGLAQLPVGAPVSPWMWPTAALPPGNWVGPPAPFPGVVKSEDTSSSGPTWAPLPVMNGYGAPALAGYNFDPRYATSFPLSSLRENVAGLSFATTQSSRPEQEKGLSPVPSVQTESCSSAGHTMRNKVRLNCPSSSTAGGCEGVLNPQDMTYGEAGDTGMELLVDMPQHSGNSFVPDIIQIRAGTKAEVQEVAHNSQYKATTDIEQAFSGSNSAACTPEDTVHLLPSTHQDGVQKLDQMSALIERSNFSTGRLDNVISAQ